MILNQSLPHRLCISRALGDYSGFPVSNCSFEDHLPQSGQHYPPALAKQVLDAHSCWHDRLLEAPLAVDVPCHSTGSPQQHRLCQEAFSPSHFQVRKAPDGFPPRAEALPVLQALTSARGELQHDRHFTRDWAERGRSRKAPASTEASVRGCKRSWGLSYLELK